MKSSRVLLIMILLFVQMACSSEEKSQKESVSTESAQTKVLRQNTNEKKSVFERKRSEVLVGGCDSACADYKEAFVNYLQAALQGDGGAQTIAFLETSEMVFNSVRMGDGWVELWRNDNIEQRRNEIANFAQTAHSWVERGTLDSLNVSIQNNITFSEDDGPGFLAFYKPPSGVVDDNEMSEWRYRIQKRGWEWLISEIQYVESP